jgi:HSP20 family protein
MLLDLEKWDPFKFLRHCAGKKGATAQAGAQPAGDQGATQKASASATPATAATSAWPDRSHWPLPEPLHLLADLIRDPFGGLGPLGNWFGDFSPSQFQPRVDVTDDGDALRIVAELPGLTRDDVELEVIEDMLVLSGDKRIESNSDEKGCYRVERVFGHFQRAIPLPAGIDLERVEATFANGVLTVRVPKTGAEAAAKRRIEIK